MQILQFFTQQMGTILAEYAYVILLLLLSYYFLDTVVQAMSHLGTTFGFETSGP